MRNLTFTLLAMLLSLASYAVVAPISGPSTICLGSTGAMTDATPGGVWTSTSPFITIGMTTGIVTGVAMGAADITYTVGPDYATYTVTVVAIPGAISGPSSICVGSSAVFTDPTPGGAWTIYPTTVAVMGVGGVVTGIAPGTATIVYASLSGCTVSHTISVNPLPAAITGVPYLCAGGTTTLASATPGGTWSSSNVTIATIGMSTGIATGVSYGATTISYTIPTGCSITTTITVSPTSAAYNVTGGGSYCSGGSGISVGLDGSTPGCNYQLFNGGTPVGSAVGGTGSAITFGPQTAAGTYTAVANYGTSCSTTMTGSASISVGALPVPFLLTGGGSYCGGSGLHIMLSGSQTGVVYQLYNGAMAVGAAVAGSGSTLDFGTFTTPGSYTCVGANSITGCVNSMTGTAAITTGTPPTVYTLTGAGSYCAGGSGVHLGLSSSDAGVNYSLYNGTTLVSTLPGTGGAIDFGFITPAGSYSVVATNPGTGCSSSTSVAAVAINPLPVVNPVTGGGSYCSGGSGVAIGLAGSEMGVSYQLYMSGTAVGTPLVGTGLALDFGLHTAAGTYTVVATNTATSCVNTMAGSATVAITPVVATAVAVTSGSGTTVCAGTLVTFTATPTGGGISPTYAWTVNGIAVGGSTDTYSYVPVSGDVVGVTMTSSAPCASPATASASLTMTVTVATITAAASVASCGGLVTITATGGVSYSWSPATGLSCTACAVTTTTPAASASYTVTGTDGTGCTGTASVTVDGNRISGHIIYSGAPTDTFRVWLVQFNPSDSSITAEDSLYSCMDAGIPYYEFYGKAAGNYLVKAKLLGTTPGTSGYIPTYGTSTPRWDSATTITHATSANTQDITMVYGTVPAGPGFISGYVVSGAGKGTSGDVPVSGMIIYLKNAAGQIVTYTNTAPDGTYSFSGLAYGTYVIYPETYKYYTSPSTPITLVAGADTAVAVNFKKHTTYGTITPYDNTTVRPLPATSNLLVYPNPAANVLNIVWNDKTGANASVTITDVIGKTVIYANLSAGQGQTQINISEMQEGIYTITVRSAESTYNTKLIKVKG